MNREQCLPPFTIAEAAAAIRGRRQSPPDLLAECLATIDRFEPDVHAWIVVDRTGAMHAARQAAREIADAIDRGPLHGIPMGIKDIVDVAGMPTRAGSSLTSDQPAARDATVVERLRAAGAVIVGKTVTTQFACFDPSPTRNPWNLAHTPGGSSSGSAAAVALGMCLGAIGSQTGGSITRPASYCGVAGVKPTFGRVSRAGVLPVSFHLDHVGPIARTAADCATMLAAIAGEDTRDPASSPVAEVIDPGSPWLGASTPAASKSATAPPRLGVLRKFFFDEADSEVTTATERALQVLAAAGARIVDAPLPAGFDQVHTMHRRLYVAEVAQWHRAEFGAPRAGYGPKMSEFLEEGFRTSMSDYQEALRHQVAFAHAMARTLAGFDALLTPSTVTAAPASLTSTGDPRFNSPWSHAGVPTVSIPCALTPGGMPVSLQLIGPAWSEAKLLSIAISCEEKLNFRLTPPMLARIQDARTGA